MATKTKNNKKNTNKKGGQQSFEFGKKLTFLIVIFFLFNFEGIVITSFALMYKFGDLTPLNELLLGTFTVVGTVVTSVTAFYQWKSKNENLIKIKKELGQTVTNTELSKNLPEIIEDSSDEDDCIG